MDPMTHSSHPSNRKSSTAAETSGPSFQSETQRAASSGQRSSSYGNVVVLFAFIIMVVNWSIFFSFGVYFKPMIAEFGWTRAMTAGAFSLASFISGFVTAYLGWMNDRFGSRRVLSICGLLLGIGSLLMSRTQVLWHFYVFYGLIIGLAMGGGFIPLISTVTRWFSSGRRGLMTGIVASGVGFGALIGPQVSNALLLCLGWRTAYLVTGLAALALVVTAAQFLRNASADTAHSTEPSSAKLETPPSAAYTSATLPQALCSAQFWLFSVAGFCYGYVLFSLTVHIVPHAVDQGMAGKLAAGMLSTYGALSIVGKILFGRILDIINARKTQLIGFSLMTVAFLALAFAERTGAMFAAVGLFGFFYGASTVSHSPITANLFGLRAHGLIMGVFGISVTLGGAVGPFFTGFIFDHQASYQTAFVICSAMSLLGVAATALLKDRLIKLPPTSIV